MENRLNFDAIISDNRYGFYSRKTTSLILCHQLILHKGENLLSKTINNLHAILIKKFNHCIVPDQKPWPDIAGDLSMDKSHIDPVYIGPLSRFYNKPAEKRRDPTELLILLSGQEPLRTRWERKIVRQLQRKKQKATIVGGNFSVSHQVQKDGITYIPYSYANDLKELIISAKYIVCRAGYSTIMELLSLKKTAILVPTPGQPEQQYLASHLSRKGWFVNANEKNCLEMLPLSDNTKLPGHIDFNKFDELYEILF